MLLPHFQLCSLSPQFRMPQDFPVATVSSVFAMLSSNLLWHQVLCLFACLLTFLFSFKNICYQLLDLIGNPFVEFRALVQYVPKFFLDFSWFLLQLWYLICFACFWLSKSKELWVMGICFGLTFRLCDDAFFSHSFFSFVCFSSALVSVCFLTPLLWLSNFRVTSFLSFIPIFISIHSQFVPEVLWVFIFPVLLLKFCSESLLLAFEFSGRAHFN